MEEQLVRKPGPFQEKVCDVKWNLHSCCCTVETSALRQKSFSARNDCPNLQGRWESPWVEREHKQKRQIMKNGLCRYEKKK